MNDSAGMIYFGLYFYSPGMDGFWTYIGVINTNAFL